MFKIQTTLEKRLVLMVLILMFVILSISFALIWQGEEKEVAFVLETGGKQESVSVLDQAEGEEQSARAGDEQVEDEEGWAQAEDEQTETREIMVDVKGAVNQPGVYTLFEGERIHAALEAAGGLAEGGTTLTVNLAQKLTDGMVIYIPTLEEIEDGNAKDIPSFTGDDHSAMAQGKVNINTATVDQLSTLPGIGPSKAKAIVEYRQKHGSFEQVEDLLNVTGIGEKTLEQIREWIER